ncbi:hypothetical protein B7G54_17920 [Burkholderia puraquae]|uniref:Uncharacterized protein n=1 Tax=Burkholderia puraquae TaxID=1904757 RepID=A0A1X1PFV8_9BURK|nr:hypothetical protein B7G54_17920 [Burkholderia puraquae]
MGSPRRWPVNGRIRIDAGRRLLQHDAEHCYHSRHAAPVPGAALTCRSRSPCFRTRRAARCRPGPACH